MVSIGLPSVLVWVEQEPTGLTSATGPEDPNYCVLGFKTERYNLLVDWKEARGILLSIIRS